MKVFLHFGNQFCLHLQGVLVVWLNKKTDCGSTKPPAHPEDCDAGSSRNVGKPSHIVAALCRENCIEFCRRESLKACISTVCLFVCLFVCQSRFGSCVPTTLLYFTGWEVTCVFGQSVPFVTSSGERHESWEGDKSYQVNICLSEYEYLSNNQ